MSVEVESLAARHAAVQAQIAASCEAAGRSRVSVKLVAVSKTHPAEVVVEALKAGQVDFGENRPEEAVEKIDRVAGMMPGAEVRWHMIGHIQRRKARLVVSRFALVHSIDSVKLAAKLSRLAEDAGTPVAGLLEINVSGEASKSGFSAYGWQDDAEVRESLWNNIQSILDMPGLKIGGLMTLAPIFEEAELARPVFANLRQLRDALQNDFPAVALDELSMGMTDDFHVAIEEGATLVRIGRAIFGPRTVR